MTHGTKLPRNKCNMANQFSISTLGYGIGLFSLPVLQQCCNDMRVKTRNLLAYFGKHNDFFYYCLSKGAILPIHHLNIEEISVVITLGRISMEDVIQYGVLKSSWKGLNLSVLFPTDIEKMIKERHQIK